jgi:hypothetical protein
MLGCGQRGSYAVSRVITTARERATVWSCMRGTGVHFSSVCTLRTHSVEAHFDIPARINPFFPIPFTACKVLL